MWILIFITCTFPSEKIISNKEELEWKGTIAKFFYKIECKTEMQGSWWALTQHKVRKGIASNHTTVATAIKNEVMNTLHDHVMNTNDLPSFYNGRIDQKWYSSWIVRIDEITRECTRGWCRYALQEIWHTTDKSAHRLQLQDVHAVRLQKITMMHDWQVIIVYCRKKLKPGGFFV